MKTTKKLTKEDFKKIAYNFASSRLLEDIEDDIIDYCSKNKIKSPNIKETNQARNEIYKIFTHQKK